MAMIFILLIAAFALSYGINRLVITRGTVAKVTKRSNHKKPTPQGGGIGILLSYSICYVGFFLWVRPQIAQNSGDYYPLFIHIELANIFYFWLPIALLAITSWINDRRHLSFIVRLIVQFVAVLLALQGLLLNIDISGWEASGYFSLLPIIGWAAIALGFVWFINLYNFMDGINGLMAVETITILLTYALIMDIPAQHVMLVGACLGFLLLNFPKAKLFAGDVGSIPLGFIVAYLGITFAAEKQSIIAALIPPLYFIADSTITLALRTWRRKKFWEAHSEHFYQQAVRHKGFSHTRVTLTIAGLNIALGGLALWSFTEPLAALVIAMLAVAAVMWHFHKPA